MNGFAPLRLPRAVVDVAGPDPGRAVRRLAGTVLPAPSEETRRGLPLIQGLSADGGGLRRSFLELGALPGAVPCARLHARQVAWEWGLAALCEDVELVVSELVTNAVQVARPLRLDAPLRLWLLAGRAEILTVVWDAGTQPPVRMHAGQEAESGRGLMLVEALTARWDWYPVRAPCGGKAVWALLR
jgi:anti-sigma regulatory factor (Ser/Thr protein kinase)